MDENGAAAGETTDVEGIINRDVPKRLYFPFFPSFFSLFLSRSFLASTTVREKRPVRARIADSAFEQ